MACCAVMLDWYEPWHISSYRQKAIDEIYEHVCADDVFSHGISIGPVCVKTLTACPSSNPFILV